MEQTRSDGNLDRKEAKQQNKPSSKAQSPVLSEQASVLLQLNQNEFFSFVEKENLLPSSSWVIVSVTKVTVKDTEAP